VFRRLFTNLKLVGRAEKIPLEYLIEALILIGFKRMATFTRARPKAIEDISRHLGFEVVSAAQQQYREDMLAEEGNGKKPARRAPPRGTEAASADAASTVADPVPAAASAGGAARSRSGRPARSASRRGLARKRPGDGRR
jgi:hypothetical protein